MKIISRMDAKLDGLKRYYTGQPCKHGHDLGRYVSNGSCVKCHYLYQQANPGRVKKWRDRCYLKNKEKILARNRVYYKKDYHANKERYKGYMVKYCSENKEKISARKKRYWAENKDTENAKRRARYANK